MITSVDVEKVLDKIQPLTRMVIEGTYLNVIKAIYDKPTFNVIERKEKRTRSVMFDSLQPRGL